VIPNKGELERQILNLVSDVAQLRAAGNAVGVNNADVFVFQPGGTARGYQARSRRARAQCSTHSLPASARRRHRGTSQRGISGSGERPSGTSSELGREEDL
jgi:hypothetical protein